MTERVIVLDRDGVINQDTDDYVKTPAEWIPIPGSLEAITRLWHGGYRLFIVTNQSGIRRGLFDLKQLHGMHRKLRDLLAQQGGQVEFIAFCPHGPEDGCVCRKPHPGLLHAIAQRIGGTLVGAPFIGDSFSDIEAARTAGMKAWLVRTGKGERTLKRESERLADVAVFSDLAAVADYVLAGGIRR